jgi:hypothetical protein
MMPLHRNMVRSQCRIVESRGGGLGGVMLTMRLPAAARSDFLADIVEKPGITGAHLLKTDTPDARQTTEQRIRGGDAAADWIVLVSGYDQAVLQDLAGEELGKSSIAGLYHLAHAITPADL